MLSDGRSVRPSRDHLVVRQLEPEDKTAGAILLLHTVSPFTPAKVLAVGPNIDEVQAGDVVWVEGWRSGIELEPDVRIVHTEIVVGVVVPTGSRAKSDGPGCHAKSSSVPVSPGQKGA